MPSSSSPVYPYPGGVAGAEPPDPIPGATGHFGWSNWIKQFVKNLNADKVAKSGDTMTGPLTLPVVAPTLDTEAANKKYVDDQDTGVKSFATSQASAAANTKVPLDGSTPMTGPLVIPIAAPTLDNQAANKKYVDDQDNVVKGIITSSVSTAVNDRVAINGSTPMTGQLVLPGTDPTLDNQAARKRYVDTTALAAQSAAITEASRLDGTKLDRLTGGAMTGPLTVLAPTSDMHAATRKYVLDSLKHVPRNYAYGWGMGASGVKSVAGWGPVSYYNIEQLYPGDSKITWTAGQPNITFTEAGIFLVSYEANGDSSTAGFRFQVQAYKNNNTQHLYESRGSDFAPGVWAGGGQVSTGHCFMLPVAAGDTLKFGLRIGAAGSITWTSRLEWLSILRLSD